MKPKHYSQIINKHSLVYCLNRYYANEESKCNNLIQCYRTYVSLLFMYFSFLPTLLYLLYIYICMIQWEKIFASNKDYLRCNQKFSSYKPPLWIEYSQHIVHFCPNYSPQLSTIKFIWSLEFNVQQHTNTSLVSQDKYRPLVTDSVNYRNIFKPEHRLFSIT